MRAMGQTLLLAAGFLVLVGVSPLSVILVNRARSDNDWVVHTVEVENQISTLLLRIRTAESTARSYLLTDEQRYLDDHRKAVEGIRPDIENLAKITTDNPAQVENARRLRQRAESRLDEFEKAIDFANRRDTAGGIAMLRESDSGVAARRVEEIAAAMQAE